ncbi:MAG: acyl-CoA synthetase, partial [Planctomycetia bacterium]|nr:acyl-CoA synthetase [Planctomycetia bacterium]
MDAQAELDAYEKLWQSTDPWAAIPQRYNLGVALTRGNVEAGRGERVCLTWENSAGQSRRFTYAQMDEHSSRFASALSRLGVKRGDRVLLRLPNLPEFYIAALAVAKLGAVFIPSSTQFRVPELQYRLRDSDAVAAISTTGLMKEVVEARPNCPALKHLIAVPYSDVPLAAGQNDFWSLLNSGDANFAPADTSRDDVAFIAYTSGTTGDPKGVVHCHRYAIGYDPLIRYWHDYRDDDVCACPAELGWLLPVASTFLYAMRWGIRIVLYHPLDGRFRAADWFGLIARHRITNFTGTPTVYRMLVGDAAVGQADLSSLRHGVSAGEPLPPDTIASVERAMGFTPLDGIGMSECMVYCFNMVGSTMLAGSCGRPGPGCDIRLMDDHMQEVPVGE